MLHPVLSCSARLLLLSYLRIISPACAGPVVTYKYTVPFHVISTSRIVNNCLPSCLRSPDVSRQSEEKKNAPDAMRTQQHPESLGTSSSEAASQEGEEQQQAVRKSQSLTWLCQLGCAYLSSRPPSGPSTRLHHAPLKRRGWS